MDLKHYNTRSRKIDFRRARGFGYIIPLGGIATAFCTEVAWLPPGRTLQAGTAMPQQSTCRGTGFGLGEGHGTDLDQHGEAVESRPALYDFAVLKSEGVVRAELH